MCDVNLVHIAQFADLVLKCIINDKRAKKKLVKTTYEFETQRLNPETGLHEPVKETKTKWHAEKATDDGEKFVGDGKVGFLFHNMRIRMAKKEQRFVHSGQGVPKKNKCKANGDTLHNLVQTITKVWAILIGELKKRSEMASSSGSGPRKGRVVCPWDSKRANFSAIASDF